MTEFCIAKFVHPSIRRSAPTQGDRKFGKRNSGHNQVVQAKRSTLVQREAASLYPFVLSPSIRPSGSGHPE